MLKCLRREHAVKENRPLPPPPPPLTLQRAVACVLGAAQAQAVAEERRRQAEEEERQRRLQERIEREKQAAVEEVCGCTRSGAVPAPRPGESGGPPLNKHAEVRSTGSTHRQIFPTFGV